MLRICSLLVLLFASAPMQAELAGSVRVIDGDTLNIGNVRVRLYGIDAPEIGQTCRADRGRIWACGTWARNEVRRRYHGARASCTVIERDHYGRVVSVCRVNGRDIGQALVAGGVALALRKYSMAYDLDEKRAVVAGIGLHAGQVQRPSDYRKTQGAGRRARCSIKGNISGTGERIFHLPGQRHYASTRIRLAAGERWFCSVEDALRAGWRKARM